MAYKINYLSQRDPAWKDINLGFDPKATIGTAGAPLTCLTMLVNGYGYTETPGTLNDKLKSLGAGNGFIGPLIVWGGLPQLFNKIKYKTIILCPDHNAPIAEINASLAKGEPVLVELDRSLAEGIQNHWVVLVARQGDDYLMTDPWPYPSDNNDTLLNPRYGFFRKPQAFITAVVWYGPKGKVPGPIEIKIYVEVKRSVAVGLRLRSHPNTSSETLAVEPAGTRLGVLEPEEIAIAKIGVFKQWLLVRDPAGREGYVAAWYVGTTTAYIPPVPEPEAMIGALNALRASSSLPAYKTSPILMSIAKEQADYMASSGKVTQLSASGQMPYQRALAASYPLAGDLSKGGFMSEYVMDGKGLSIDQVLTRWQSENPDLNTILSTKQELEVGAGSAVSGDIIYYCLDVAIPVAAPLPPAPDALRVYVSNRVETSGLRMRAKPSMGSTLVTVLKVGSELVVLDDKDTARLKIGTPNEWLNVNDAKGNSGYVAAWLVEESLVPPSPVPQIPREPTVGSMIVVVAETVAASGLRLRATPGMDGSVVSIEPAGTILTVLEDQALVRLKLGVKDEWLNVQDPQGRNGYVAAWYVTEKIIASIP